MCNTCLPFICCFELYTVQTIACCVCNVPWIEIQVSLSILCVHYMGASKSWSCCCACCYIDVWRKATWWQKVLVPTSALVLCMGQLRLTSAWRPQAHWASLWEPDTCTHSIQECVTVLILRLTCIAGGRDVFLMRLNFPRSSDMMILPKFFLISHSCFAISQKTAIPFSLMCA